MSAPTIERPTDSVIDEDEALVAWAHDFVPTLRAARAETERLARIPEAIVQAMDAAGVYRMMIPREYGGLETTISTWRRVVTELGRGDAGVGWAVTLVSACNWMASGLFPRHVTDQVFSKPGERVAGVFSPRAVKARPVEGGIVVEKGTWFFNSGVYQAQWDLLGVPLVKTAPDGTQIPTAGVALVPVSDVILLNDWDTSGLRGSGSTNVSMENVFIPDERIVELDHCNDGVQAHTFPGRPLWYSGFAPLMVSVLTYPVLGAGLHMLEEFLETLPKRDIKLTPYARQGEAPVAHLQVGQASAKIDAAILLMSQASAEIDAWAAKLEYMPIEQRARIVRDSAVADEMVWEAVDLLGSIAGGSFSRRTNALNQIWQDVKVGNMHPFVNASANYEAYGRMLCGVNPPLMPV